MADASQAGNDRDVVGFMPRGRQYGYIYTKDLNASKIGSILAHELAHGKFKLYHTFDNIYAGKLAQGSTTNLMDYSRGTHLAKWQWNQLYDPAILNGVFDRDEDGEWVDITALKSKIKNQLKQWFKSISVNSGEEMLFVIINTLCYNQYELDLTQLSYNDLKIIYKIITNNTNPTKLKQNEIEELNRIIEKTLPAKKEIYRLLSLTNFASKEALETANVKEAEILTNILINSNEDEATVIIGLLFEYKYGIGPYQRVFDANSVLTKNLLDFYLVEEGRKEFYKRNSIYKQNELYLYPFKEGSEYGTYRAFFNPASGPIKAGLNLTKQYVGGFYMDMIPHKDGTKMDMILYNAVNLKSLVLHYFYLNDISNMKPFPEKYPRIEGKTTPLGEVLQIFKWTENVNINFLNK